MNSLLSESSGVPHTVFKGNQRKYTKEFVLIYDKQTNTMTLEKLNNNILVKKTRTEPPPNKNLVTAPPPKPLENSTQRTSSKTRVSTGARKNTISRFSQFCAYFRDANVISFQLVLLHE